MTIGWEHWDYEKRRRLAASQPRVRWNWAIVGAAVIGAGIWAGVILGGRAIWLVLR